MFYSAATGTWLPSLLRSEETLETARSTSHLILWESGGFWRGCLLLPRHWTVVQKFVRFNTLIRTRSSVPALWLRLEQGGSVKVVSLYFTDRNLGYRSSYVAISWRETEKYIFIYFLLSNHWTAQSDHIACSEGHTHQGHQPEWRWCLVNPFVSSSDHLHYFLNESSTRLCINQVKRGYSVHAYTCTLTRTYLFLAVLQHSGFDRQWKQSLRDTNANSTFYKEAIISYILPFSELEMEEKLWKCKNSKLEKRIRRRSAWNVSLVVIEAYSVE